MKLDGKFYGSVFKNKDNSLVPDDQWVVFLGKDDAFPATLAFYLQECHRIGAAPEQIQAVEAMQTRLLKWRDENRALCKVPDVHPGEIK